MPCIPDFIFPEAGGFKGRLLDDYLAAGYYRMQHILFTTHYTQLEPAEPPLPVFWLRTLVKKIQHGKIESGIRKRCTGFTVHFKRAAINSDTEELYNLYRNHINFSAAEDCRSYLEDSFIENPFDSWMIEIKDQDQLIAVGYFDLGQNAISGILNFYHPAYKKYSLGKFLMLQKIQYALANNISYYYTGYISTETNKFDYKIFPDPRAMEVYVYNINKWMPYILLGKEGLKNCIAALVK
jgi:arginine-tRNA-protein transferase